MNDARLTQLQEAFDRFHSSFLGVSLHNSQCSAFDAPDLSDPPSHGFVPIMRFERRTLYRKENGGTTPITAWVCEGVIVRAWTVDFLNAIDIIGRPFDEVFVPRPRLNTRRIQS